MMGSAEMTVVLTQPTEEEAALFTRELSHEDCFAGYVFKASGQLVVTVYSLEHAIAFLGQNNTDQTVAPGEQFPGHDVQVAYMQPKALAGWIREAIGDPELADAIEAAVAEVPADTGYPPQLRAMRAVMADRYLQCMEVLGIEPQSGEDDDAPDVLQEQ